MLTGKRLFDGPGRQVLRAKMGDQAPTIGLPDEIPDRSEFAGLIRACLAPDQRQRPTASALARSLRVLLGEPRTDTPVALQIEAQPAPYQATLSGMVNTSIRPPDRSKRTRLMMIVGLVALLASAMLIGFMMREPDPITVRAIPLPEEPAKPRPPDPTPVVEPPPAPPPPVVVAPPPPRPTQPAKRPAVKPTKDKGPLKKGEFPTW